MLYKLKMIDIIFNEKDIDIVLSVRLICIFMM